jgi:hypothetical protein
LPFSVGVHPCAASPCASNAVPSPKPARMPVCSSRRLVTM